MFITEESTTMIFFMMSSELISNLSKHEGEDQQVKTH